MNEYQRIAGLIIRDIFRSLHCNGFLHTFQTGKEVDTHIEHMIISSGGIPTSKGYHGFPAASCISVNDVVCHGIPTQRRFRPYDLVSIDITCGVEDEEGNIWHADACKTFTYIPTLDFRSSDSSGRGIRHRDFARFSGCILEDVIANVRPGTTPRDIGKMIKGAADKREYGVVSDFGGHGIGKKLHQQPFIPNSDEIPNLSDEPLKTGDVICIEPMFVLGGNGQVLVNPNGWEVKSKSGEVSTHFEHTVLITEDGCEVLT